MNYVSNAKIINLTNRQEYRLEPHQLRINDDLVFEYNPKETIYNLEDSVYYSNSSVMEETILPILARIDVNQDNQFKRFINSVNANFVLELEINFIKYSMFVNFGKQKASINQHYLKHYEFEIRLKSRPFIKEEYTSNREEEYFGGAYDDYKFGYDVIKYSVDDGAYNYDGFRELVENKGQGNCYIEIEGIGTMENIEITIDNHKLSLYSAGINNKFYYSNIPNNLSLNVNDVQRLDLIDISNETNFEFNLKKDSFFVEVKGLEDIRVNVYSVVNII